MKRYALLFFGDIEVDRIRKDDVGPHTARSHIQSLRLPLVPRGYSDPLVVGPASLDDGSAVRAIATQPSIPTAASPCGRRGVRRRPAPSLAPTRRHA